MLARPQGTWTDTEAVDSLEREACRTESRASIWHSAHTEPPTCLPCRHDFIFSENCIFFSEEKEVDGKETIRTSKMPFKDL